MIIFTGIDLRYSLAERERSLRLLQKEEREGVLLHTCNRVEVYRGAGAVPPGVARHLFRVTAGLESALLGENAVQGQVKAAYERARRRHVLSPELHRLFQRSLRAGKRVRTETGITRGALSHAKAVLEILRRDAVDIRRAAILIIGAGNLNAHLVRYLAEKGSRAVYIANRTFAKAETLARRYGGIALTFEGFTANLSGADIVISATSAPHFIIRPEHYAGTKPVIMFDLGVPRDIDPAVGGLPQVSLYNVEDIESRVEDNRRRRLEEIRKAEGIIEEELLNYLQT
ncbi:MAG: glutamyl-tRNA reductase [Endomicrobiales bacterium]